VKGRFAVRTIAFAVGTLLAGVATIWLQGPGSSGAPDIPAAVREAQPPLDAAPLPQPDGRVLLAWTRRTLDPELARAASTSGNVDTASVVHGGTLGLVR
jgi:hypothetical protein